MNGFTIRVLLVVTFVFSSVNFTSAQFPFRKSRSQSQNNTNSRELTVKNGPWLIMCASFSGETAEHSALALVNELRRHRLSAYLYRHKFDYSGSMVGLGWQKPDQDGNFSRTPIKMKVANNEIVEETAVLVGDFPSTDDGRAQKALQKIKTMKISNIPGLTNEYTGIRANPLKTAFMLPNPLLPEEYFRRPKIDSFIYKNNKKLEYSLLKCQGLYSVKVASFRGTSTIDQDLINNGNATLQSKKNGERSTPESRLIEAEEKAHDLTRLLRSKGIEAYEFHDRTESFVCIGSFDWVTRKTNDRVMNNPDIVKIVNICKPEIRNLPGAPNSILPKSLRGIPFDPDPVPIMVPKFDRSERTASRPRFLGR